MGFEDFDQSTGFESEDFDIENGTQQHAVRAPKRSRRGREEHTGPVRDRMGRTGISDDAEGDDLIAPDKPIRLSSGTRGHTSGHRVMKSSSEFSYLFSDEQPDDRPSKGEKAARLAALAYDEKVDGDGEKYDGILNAENPEPIIKKRRERPRREPRPEPVMSEPAPQEEPPAEPPAQQEEPKSAGRFSKRRREEKAEEKKEKKNKKKEEVPVVEEPIREENIEFPEEDYGEPFDEGLMPPMGYPPMYPPMGYPPYPYMPPYQQGGYPPPYPYMQYPPYPVMPVSFVYPVGYPQQGTYRKNRQVSPHRLAVRKRGMQPEPEQEAYMPEPEPVYVPEPEPVYVPEPEPEPVFEPAPEPEQDYEPLPEPPPAPRFNRKRPRPEEEPQEEFFAPQDESEPEMPSEVISAPSARFNRRNRAAAPEQSFDAGQEDSSSGEAPASAPRFNRRSRS